ncbi:MAG TPA: hypothetical protein VFZ53_23650 [Polyangiaceae bacterium]
MALTSIARVAGAERARPAVTLRASDPSCPAESELVDRVERRLLPASVVDPHDRFDVEVEQGAEGMSAHLFVTRADGTRATRVVEGASCDDLFDSVAFIAAMTIDPDTALQVPADAPAALPTPPPAASSALVSPLSVAGAEASVEAPKADCAEAPPEAGHGASGALEVELGVLVEGTTAIAPYLAPVGRLFFAARFPLRRLETSVRASFARSLENEVPVDAERGAVFTYTAGRAEGCLGPRLTGAPVRIEGCATLDVGALDAESYGVQPEGRETRVWVAPGALGRFGTSPLRHLALVAEAGLLVPVTRYRYELHDPDALVFRPPPVALALGAGVALRLE